ncbi:hypothetical protein [Massilia sp. TWP1-3-3]|uniref:hypothetical protein n=1 Tax=Massilia sp. TWP1-3-3 TaxID=2804573 RepID=UPI003CF5BBA0
MITAPPRPLPRQARLGFFNSFTMWLGAAFFALGLLFVFIYLAATDVSRHFSKDDPRVAGVVTKVFRPSNSSDTATSRNITYDYRYQVNGRTYDAQMVSTDYLQTDQVNVQYILGAPEMSRIEGLDANSSFGLLVLALGFGLMGLLVLFISVSGALYDIRRIRHGITINATIVRKQLATGGSARVLQFTATDGLSYDIAADTQSSIVSEGESRVVFYVPGEAASAVMLDYLEPEIRAYLN